MPFDAANANIPGVTDLPQFKPRRNQSRLDFRPVIWSLRNRPDEWEWGHGHYCIVHKPSRHEIWVSSGLEYYNLYNAGGCSCTRLSTRTKPSWWDRRRFHSAFKAWRRSHGQTDSAAINRQFAAHFITHAA